jgi:hypothetical protein
MFCNGICGLTGGRPRDLGLTEAANGHSLLEEGEC